MVVVADASVAIRGDLSGFNRDLKGAERSTATLGEQLRGVLSPRNLIGAAGALGIGLGIRELIGWAGDASVEFQGLERATRSVDDIFGSSAGTIRQWGEVAADAAGLSKREVSESAATMGSMLQNLGFDAGTAADTVVTLQQRAADMAATFGGPTSGAIDAIGSLLRGEFDTIEKFGVKIKQADVNARILALGLDTSTDASKRNAESVATLSLFYDQTADASGRFGEDLDTLGGKLAANQAKIDNFNAGIGEGVATLQLSFINLLEATGDDFRDFTTNFGSQHVEILRIADKLGIGFGEMKDRITTAMDETGLSFDEVVAGMEKDGTEAAAGIAKGLAEGAGLVSTEAARIADIPRKTMVEAYQALRAAAYQSQVEVAKGLIDGQNAPQVAMDAALQLLEEELTTEQEIVRLKGQLLTLETAAGIASQEGKDAAAIAIDASLQVVRDRLALITSDFYTDGYNIGVAWANGLQSASDYARLMAWELAASANPALHGLSPPKEGPLKHIDQSGRNVGMAWAGGLAEGVAGSVGALMGGLTPGISPMAPAMGGAGNTYSPTYNVDARGRIQGHSIEDIGYGLKRLGEMGVLPGSRSN